MTSEPRKIVIAAGGTAGHVVPALAVAQVLRADGAEVEFIGGARAEARLVPAAGFPLHTINVKGLSRSNPLLAARAVGLAAAALPRVRSLLCELAPDAVMGGGGYVAGPVGMAALSLRLPLVLTEADSHLGLTNRVLARGARSVCLAFPIAGPPGRALPHHRPPDTDPRAGPRRLPAGAWACRRRRCACSCSAARWARGRSTSRRSGARRRPGARPAHLRRARLSRAARRACCPRGYDLREYLDRDQFADALAAADLVVARSGGSVFEIAAQGLPSILIPYPSAAGDHQSSNARWMADAGAAIVIPDGELTGPRLGSAVASLLADPRRLQAMGAGGAGARAAGCRAGRRAMRCSRRRGHERCRSPWSGRRLHFVGVGGAGMSGYARAAQRARRRASAARTAADGLYLRAARRRRRPRPPRSVIAAENVPQGEGVELIYSSAVGPENIERRRGARAGHPRAPARRAARRAERAAADDRGRRHARQDDDLLDARPCAAGPPDSTPAG